MKLRHNKPLNSYIVQTNFDKKEERDEEYFKNPLFVHKANFEKSKPLDDKIGISAQILCRFVNGINENYRKFSQSKLDSQRLRKNKSEDEKRSESLIRQNRQREYNIVKEEKVVVKPEQRVEKYNKNVESLEIGGEQQKKFRPEKSKPQQQPLPMNTTSIEKKKINEQEGKPLSTKDSVNPNIQDKGKLINPPQENNLMNNIHPNVSLQQMLLQEMMKNSMNNAATFGYPQYQMSPNFYSQFNMEKMRINQLSAMQGFPQFYQQINLNNRNFYSHPLNNFTQNHLQPQNPPKQPTENSTIKNKAPQTEPLNEREKEKGKGTNSFIPTKGSVDFRTKSCCHIAIAYNIHFEILKEKGHFNNFGSPEGIEKMDPTYSAKKLKMQLKK